MKIWKIKMSTAPRIGVLCPFGRDYQIGFGLFIPQARIFGAGTGFDSGGAVGTDMRASRFADKPTLFRITEDRGN